MAVDKQLLDILCCPVTKQPVKLLGRDQLDILNMRIREAKVSSMDGSAVQKELSEALITEDGKTVYPVDDGIPVMLEDQGIAMGPLMEPGD